MRLKFPFRRCLGAALTVLFAAAPAVAWWRAPQPAPVPAASRPNHTPVRPAARPPVKAGQNQEHLQQWMQRHSSLSLPDQQRALEGEPGFRLYPAQTQQRMRDELVRLNNMPQQQRDRILARNEIVEKMTAPQRQQYRSAVQDFASLPPDRRRLMGRAVLDLREMPQDQRQGVINSDRFRAQFSDGERSTLNVLLTGEPTPQE